MEIIYEEVVSELGDKCIKATQGDVLMFIPIDPANSDYQTYLAWLENPEAALSTPNV